MNNLENTLKTKTRDNILEYINPDDDYSLKDLKLIEKRMSELHLNVPEWIYERIYELKVKYFGRGFLGFWYGTWPLSFAFWIVGVLPALVILLFGLELVTGSSNARQDFMILIFVTFVFRLFAWISIFRCKRNTKSQGFKIFVTIVTSLDILHKIFYWAMMVLMMKG